MSRAAETRLRSPLPPGDSDPSTWLSIAVLSCFVAVLFHEILIGRVLFWSDILLTFEPLFGQLGERLRTGAILWSSLLETGKPILANPTQAVLYPLNLVFAVLPAPRAIAILTLIHILIGSIGTFVLGRRIGLRNDAALASGLVFAGAGTTLSVTPYIGLSWCTVWLPWLLVFCDRVSRREKTGRSMVLLGMVVVMMLTIAEPFVLVAAGLGVALWLGDGCLRPDGTWGQRIRNNLLLPVLAAAAAAVVVSPYLLAIALNLPSSVRALGFVWEGITIWSLHPLRLFECLAPGVFGFLGSPDIGAFWALATVPSKGFPYVSSLYLGAPVLALLIAGIRTPSPRRSPLAIWLTVLVLLALGRWGPLYPWLEGVPGFDSVRYPVKWLVPAIVPLSVLAGIGMRNVFAPQDGRCRRAFYLTASLAAVVLAGVAAAVHLPWFTDLLEIVGMRDNRVFSPGDRSTVFFSCLRGLVPALGAICILALARRFRLRHHLATLALVLLVGADLITANGRLVATTGVELYDEEPVALRIVRSDPEGFQRIRIDENSSGASRWAAGNPTLREIAQFQKQILAGYVAARHGVPSALTRDTEATGPFRVYSLRVLGESAPPREQAMVYGSASITHLVTDREIEDPEYRHLGSTRTIAGTTIHVYRDSLSQPRVRTVPSVIPYTGDDGYRRAVGGSSPDLFSEAVLVDTEDLERAPEGIRDLIPILGSPSTGHEGTARIVEDHGHRLTIEAETDRDVVLVINDAYLPQWSARVDGIETRVLRVNYCFRGVLLHEGRHTVVLEYNPWGSEPDLDGSSPPSDLPSPG